MILAFVWVQWESLSTMKPGSGSTRWWVTADVRWWTLGGRRVSVPEGELEQAWGLAGDWWGSCMPGAGVCVLQWL